MSSKVAVTIVWRILATVYNLLIRLILVVKVSLILVIIFHVWPSTNY